LTRASIATPIRALTPAQILPLLEPPRPGRGTLVFRASAGRTFVARAHAESPLKLLLPKNHGDARWAFLATYGGGLVDGDAIALDVTVERGARALLGTQASTKVYRSPRAGTRHSLVAEVEDDALLVIVPDPVAPFAGASYEQRATYRLAPRASLVVFDALSSGRSARGERWAFARYDTRTRIERAGEIVANDAIVLDATEADVARTMGRFDAIATLFAFGPAATRAAVLASVSGRLERRAEVLAVASPLGNDGAMLRIAGTRLEDVTSFARASLRALRASLGDDPFARKW
jgi:urease accessory protein